MCGSGISVFKSLDVIENETENARLRDIIQDVKGRIQRGTSLREAFGRHPNVFTPFFLGMLEGSETGGSLDIVLERVAAHLEKQEDLRQKVVTAFAYPIVVMVLCCLVVTFLVTFVVPVFESAYAQIGVSLPLPTVALMTVSEFIRSHWWALAGAVIALGLVMTKGRRIAPIKRLFDTIKMNAPLVGKLNRKIALTRFLRNFAVMTRCGVPLTKSIDVAEGIACSYLVSSAANAIRTAVQSGEPISKSMRAFNIFPPMVVGMAAAGEESGSMPEMMEKSADYLDRDIDRSIKRLLVKIEPGLTVALAAVVGFILIAVYLPMFDVMKTAA
jgi:type IV pilus assembly protein PilC